MGLHVQSHDLSVHPVETDLISPWSHRGNNKWLIQSCVFVGGHQSTVWAALSGLIAPRDMLSLINSESADPDKWQRKREEGDYKWVCRGGEERKGKSGNKTGVISVSLYFSRQEFFLKTHKKNRDDGCKSTMKVKFSLSSIKIQSLQPLWADLMDEAKSPQ